MTILFGEYELLAQSGLFDPKYYLKSNPDIAALNVDPLLHYLEQGCRERRDPSAGFDTSHYLKLCNALGETPVNALAHYLTIGIKRGLTPKPGSKATGRRVQPLRSQFGELNSSLPEVRELRDVAQQQIASMLSVDIPRIVGGAAEMPVRGGLSIVGWGITAGGAAGVDIALDGVRITSARCGLRRPDVAAAHPDSADALLSGYASHVPPKALAVGRHDVTVSMRDGSGHVERIDFSIDVQEVSGDRGPCALRRKMSQVEVDLQLDTLSRLNWHPTFRMYLPFARNAMGIGAARRTIESLARQTYTQWELWLIPIDRRTRPRSSRGNRDAVPAALTADFEDIAQRTHVWGGNGHGRAGNRRKKAADTDERCLVARLAPGDELGCDAFLEFAIAGGFDRNAELLYCDERRMSPIDGKVGAYFKPGWSPDLLLSTNYLGRAWCADSRLLERARIAIADLAGVSDYELTLRLTETARGVCHVPKLVYQSGERGGENAGQERQALNEALKRRNIIAEIQPGCLGGYYRIKRKLKPARVSIIIPTCAAGGLIKDCLETLRAGTAYQDYEIICIENIDVNEHSWKHWLKTHADIVLETQEPFNWSRYNNLAAARASGNYLLFLNDDIEIIDPEWLDALLEQAQRPEVGIVGALLLYPDRSVQQAGVVLDGAGRGRHAFRHQSDSDPGYFGLALTQRNVISVTGACLMTRRETFETLGRFDESHAVINNDLDYCLRAWTSGLLNVYTPHARLIHHELGSRAHVQEHYDAVRFCERWRSVIALGDPYFNPNLARDQEQFSVELEPVETIYAGHPLFSRASVHRILVVKLDHIGDCITALPALRRLKHHFPDAQISVLTGRASASIWKAETIIDEIIEFNFFHARSALGKIAVSPQDKKTVEDALRSRRFDLAIDLRKQPDTREVLQLSGARILVGFDHQGRFPWLDVALEWDEDVPLRSKHGHVSDDLIALTDAVRAHCEADRSALMERPKGMLTLPKSEQRRLFSKPLICIHPTSGSPMRQWPPEKFTALIQLLLDLQQFNIAVIGGPDETEYVEQLLESLPRNMQLFNLVGRFGLEELPTLLARSVLFIGNNSGPQHLAAALGIPTIGIHSGVVDATEWGPIGPRAMALRRAMSCSPCFIEYPKDCHRGLACLIQFPVRDVFHACLRALPRGAGTSDA
ncbi:MAG: glycosyltransferase family 9 protein [Steroidobacteraceae bacterium]